MKDRALRRHQDFRAKARKQNEYNSCIGDRPEVEKQQIEGNIEKLKKVCVSSHYDQHSKKAIKKTVQEMRHDITMREQLQP